MAQSGTIARNILIMYIRMFATVIIEFYISRV
ncbi:unknown [Prevotella sp. CAG:604]|nr:unknown [Prevotella sp. CAG:604]